MAVLLVLLVGLVGMVNQTSSLWRNTNGRIEQFRQAREGFEAMTRRLSQATLNTYLDYVDASGKPRVFAPNSTSATVQAFAPDHYARQSELRFLCGPGLAERNPMTPPRPTHSVFFQAPLGFVADGNPSDALSFGGLDNLLNTWGYYIEFNNDGKVGLDVNKNGLNTKPTFVTTPDRYRFRLMELMEASEQLSLYNYTSANPGLKSSDQNGLNWFIDALPPLPSSSTSTVGTPPPATWSHVLAENVVALVILPKLSPADQAAGSYFDRSLAPAYTYDSTLPGAGATDAALDSQNQLPPLLTVTMVAVDETTYSRFQNTSSAMPTSLGLDGLFQTVGDTRDATNKGFAHDLQTLQTNLQAGHVNFRVFTTDVGIKAAKWSRAR